MINNLSLISFTIKDQSINKILMSFPFNEFFRIFTQKLYFVVLESANVNTQIYLHLVTCVLTSLATQKATFPILANWIYCFFLYRSPSIFQKAKKKNKRKITKTNTENVFLLKNLISFVSFFFPFSFGFVFTFYEIGTSKVKP